MTSKQKARELNDEEYLEMVRFGDDKFNDGRKSMKKEILKITENLNTEDKYWLIEEINKL